MAHNLSSVFVVRAGDGRQGGDILGVYAYQEDAERIANGHADRIRATGDNPHLLIQEWSGNLLLRVVHAYGTDHPMNG